VKSKVVAILETRTGAHLAELIARRGASTLWAPALEEVPDVNPRELQTLIAQWRSSPCKLVIFQTGVGTHALFQATDELNLTSELLDRLASSVVVVRGPKPVGELSARGVRIDIRATSPFTTQQVLQSVAHIPLSGERVLVQRYGAVNQGLVEAIGARGATVRELATYKWAVPQDTQPLHDLLDALAASRIDAVVFTSAVQIQNLYTVAQALGRHRELAVQLNRVIVASIGPVCTVALAAHGIKVTFEANPPKLGPLIAGLETALGAGD